MEFYLTATGLVTIFIPAAILLLLKHFDAQVIKKYIVEEFKRRINVPDNNRFPFGFETYSIMHMKNKYDVFLCFLPGINIAFLVIVLYGIIKTQYYKNIYTKNLREHKTS